MNKANFLKKKLGNIEWEKLEEFILKNPHILRTIKGHCFETWFDKIIFQTGHKIKGGKGDDIVDRILLGKTLQLKTPYTNGTIDGKRIAYMLHKTHGLEKRPFNLYKRNDFAEFLVGYHPQGVIICPRGEIPLHKRSSEWGANYLADPANFEWDNEWLNNYAQLGIKIEQIKNLDFSIGNKKFKKLGKMTKLSDDYIIETILNPSNFRVLEMNLMGSIREYHFERLAKESKVDFKHPNGTEEIKIDAWSNGKRLQIKGRTKSLCVENTIGVEIKGSHGRIPQRLYKKNAFDYLVVVLDPYVVPKKYYPPGVDDSKFNFVIINVDDLPLHKRSSEWGEDYLKDIFKFKINEYTINDFSCLKD